MRFKILLFTLISALFIGCSGKVQTNKLPNDKKWNTPNSNFNISEPKINAELIKDYDDYAYNFFGGNRKIAIATKLKIITTKKQIIKPKAVKKISCRQSNNIDPSITKKTNCFYQTTPQKADDYTNYYKSNVYEMGLDRGHFNE